MHYTVLMFVARWRNNFRENYVSCGFLLVCYSNIDPKTRHFSDIRLQKCRDLEIRARGHLRWYHSIDYIWFPSTIPYNFVHTVHCFEIFRFKNDGTLKTLV